MSAELVRELGDECGTFDSGGVDGNFVCARADDRAGVIEAANAAARSERDGEFRGDAANGSEKSRASIARCSVMASPQMRSQTAVD